MAFWTELYGTRKDDIIYIAIISPENDVLAYSKQMIEKNVHATSALLVRNLKPLASCLRLIPAIYA